MDDPRRSPCTALPQDTLNFMPDMSSIRGDSDERRKEEKRADSTNVGRRIVAASAATLKRTSLEFGGKNPQILFPDANLEDAADAVVFGVLFNMGECCNSGSRILVHESIADDFVARVDKRAARVVTGDPLNEKTSWGLSSAMIISAKS